MFVVTRPAWHRWAACRGRVGLFYDGHAASVTVAKAVCARCGVREACLADALAEEVDERQRHGVRGGLTATERAVLSVRRPVAS